LTPAADAAFNRGANQAERSAAGGAAGALAVVAIASGAAWLVWWGFRLLHGLPGSAEHLSQLQPGALGGMLLALVAVFGGVRTGGILVVTVLAWALAGRQPLAAPWRLLSLVVIGELLGTLLAFLVGETTPALEVETSATRLFEQFLPLALVASAAWLEHYL
jgi:hypothetical protein